MGEEEYIDERTVNVYVQRLRNKLGDDPMNPRLIETACARLPAGKTDELGFRYQVCGAYTDRL